jgi:F-type H+-transporting ATPase subunit epsilon
MAEETFFLRVLSPLGIAFEGEVRSATLPTVDGEITVLARHMPLVSVLTDGEMRIRAGEREISIAVAGGFLDTGGRSPDEPASAAGAEQNARGTALWEATVLSDFAAQSDSIEIARVEAAKARAEQLLEERKERGELAMVERDLQRAILQLKVAEKIRTRRRL